MELLDTAVDTAAPTFGQSAAHYKTLIATLRQKSALVCQGGGPETVAKHRGRGKKLARERIAALLDPGAPFLEFSTLAAEDRKSVV